MSESETARLARIECKIDTLIEIRKDHELRIKAIEMILLQAKGGWKMGFIILGAFGSIVYFAIEHTLRFLNK